MLTALSKLFNESSPDLKARLVTVYSVVAVLNVGAWLWALIDFLRPVSMLMLSGGAQSPGLGADDFAPTARPLIRCG
ncbi:hypothetical protein EB235_30335 [Mesorhizobium loti R88b]|uniref:Uncharacterized protein n=1 Tax=Mesorhizobium loti R88b TaxID=935548 RepID=A0A6M7WYM1_RHILI|nr:hypothetical protein EB235_30335 [Mesorhizobium loti R88b]